MRRSLLRIVAVLVCLVPHVAHAWDDPPAASAATPAASSDCHAPLALENAAAEPESESVSFDARWHPQLEQAAACLKQPEHARTCLRVQGHYDDKSFSAAVRTALGSERAAELHRARGRGETVMSELFALGVPPARIISVPPPTSPTFRGVLLTFDAECVPAPAEPPPPPPQPEWTQSPEAMATALKQTGMFDAEKTPSAPTPTPLSAWWLDGELAAGFMAREPSDLVYAALRPGVGVGGERWFARGFVGLAVGDNPEHRASFEWGLSGGYRALEWLELGAIGSHRLSSEKAFEATLEQTWSLGLLASERLARFGSTTLWISQSLWPLSFVHRRAELRDGTLVDIEDETSYAPRLELAFSVRAHVL